MSLVPARGWLRYKCLLLVAEGGQKKPTAQPGLRGRYGKKGRDFLPNAALKKAHSFYP